MIKQKSADTNKNKNINETRKIYITTPIFYPNSKPHLGHLHTCFIGDFLTRSYKLFGYEVFFSTGTDEHGQKIQNTASKLGITPQRLVDQQSLLFKNLMKKYHIDYDRFIRTTDSDHESNVLLIWNKLLENNYLYRSTYKGLYSERDECFYSENETVINEHNERVAISSGSTLVEISEECWFFTLSKFKEALLELYAGDLTIPLNAKQELIKYVENLKDLCVSRRVNWGITIPGSKDETIYVWIDALFNYISSIGNIQNYKEDLWTNVLHIVGKDIIIFHGVYWPALLMAVDIKPSIRLLVHGWWLIDSSKMSKSLGNVIDPTQLKLSSDYLRYYCLKSELLGHDGNFQLEQVEALINKELIGKFLNLIYRLFSLIKKNFSFNRPIKVKENDLMLTALKTELEMALSEFSPKKYLEIIMKYATLANQYIEQYTLWKGINQEHLDYLLPLVHHLIKYSGGFMIEWDVVNFYKYDSEEFTLIKLDVCFTKVTMDLM